MHHACGFCLCAAPDGVRHDPDALERGLPRRVPAHITRRPPPRSRNVFAALFADSGISPVQQGVESFQIPHNRAPSRHASVQPSLAHAAQLHSISARMSPHAGSIANVPQVSGLAKRYCSALQLSGLTAMASLRGMADRRRARAHPQRRVAGRPRLRARRGMRPPPVGGLLHGGGPVSWIRGGFVGWIGGGPGGGGGGGAGGAYREAAVLFAVAAGLEVLPQDRTLATTGG